MSTRSRGATCDSCGLDYEEAYKACPYCDYGLHAARIRAKAWKEIRWRPRSEKKEGDR